MNNQGKTLVITSLTIFFSTIILSLSGSYIFQKTTGEIIRIMVLSSLFSLFAVFVYLYEYFKDSFDNDNKEHLYRFLIVYGASLILSVVFPFMDKSGWPFIVISVSLVLFSNLYIGAFFSSGLLMISCLLSSDGDCITYVVYFMASMIALVVFHSLDENFNATVSIFITVLSLFMLETAGFIFLENEELSAEQFIMPIVNIAINTMTLFWVLKYYNENIANRYRNKYMELNDQEYSQLIRLKEKSIDEYFRSIHTAYLTERIAKACDCNVEVAKNLAYYHRIKKVFEYTQNDIKRFVIDNGFPPEAARAVVEFSDKNAMLIHKESCIVYLSDKLISTLMAIFSKDKKASVNYDELIDTLLDKQYINEALENSDLSRKDYRTIRHIMKQETLYYDFLR